MADAPPADFPHIEWQRLKRTEQRGKSSRPLVPPRPPLRPDPGGHRQQVGEQAGDAVDQLVQRRRALGVNSQNLLVLEMEFVQAAQRELLERMGARVLDEGERRVPLAEPIYCVPVTFDSPSRREAFEGHSDLPGLGLLRLRRDRGTHGAPHERRCTACFGTLEAAKTFRGDADLHARHHFEVGKSPPKRESTEVRHSWVVEFPDLATAQSFHRAAGAQSGNVGVGGLAPSEQADLLDAIDVIRSIGPDDRRGGRLRDEGVPGAKEFAIDVDLWHPADRKQVSSVIHAFRDLVGRHGGRVTDGPTPVAETFFIARVKGSQKTLDAILNYDRVAYADLPPKLPPVPATVFQKVELPAGGLPPADESAPLACLIDSGVLASHPLLSGWVHDERDFDSGEGTPVDQAGHGTHMAGFIVYGDVYRCVQNESWRPKVRLLSAKVLKNDGGYAAFPEDNDKRIETQLRTAITTFHGEYGCRVYNLSVGHVMRPYLGGRQLPWALVLDELARDLDVVLVVSAGNVPSPEIPPATTEQQLREGALEQLLGDAHAVIDPASAMLALTVGSIARGETTFKAYGDGDGRRPPLVGAPPHGPSPFTRAGRIASTGAGPAKAIKPDLVAFGGNAFLDGTGGWRDNDVLMGEPSLNLRHLETGRLLKAAAGTSVAAPFVTHVCARVENALTKLKGWRSKPPSANLIRALTVHSARVHKCSAEWVGATKKDTERRLRLLGYGMPNAKRAIRSTDQRVVLLAEDELDDEFYHIYELEIPSAFAKLKTKRHVRVTLAYDPPVRGTRKEYLVRKLYFRLIKNHTVDKIEGHARQGKDCPQPNLRPSIDWVKDSTVQSAVFEGTRPQAFNWDGQDDSFTRWHVVVRSEPRLDSEPLPPQRYALIVSFEHSDPDVRIYTKVRNRLRTRVRQNWSG